ncbi:hypothetical protein ACFPK1_12050 [Actinomycetospora rhizophila]|uniref:Uncharacterized protein n=1 Tax=Actinomycetospora rhizophila TaxID=1416876 RepID=A0ABV9ZD22_9PSEU
MDWADRTGPRARTPSRVRPAATPPGMHLAGVGQGRGPAHGRARSQARAVAGRLGAALIVFVLALLLVTGIEAVVGHPLSGGPAGHTTLGDLVHPSR